MNRVNRIHRLLVAMITLSMIVSMIGGAPLVMAEDGAGENTPVPQAADDTPTTDQEPSNSEEASSDGEAAPGDGSDPVNEEEHDQVPDPGNHDPAEDETNDPSVNEGEAGEPSDVGEDESDSMATPDDYLAMPANTTRNGPLSTDESTVSIVVTMTDGGLIPAGLRAYIFASGDWTHLENLPVESGVTSATVTFTSSYPYGSYGVGVTGNGYAPSAKVANLDTPEETYTFELNRLTGTIAATMNTSDGGDIPAGTEWTLTHEHEGVVDSGVLTDALSSGSLVPFAVSPVPFGTYELSFAPDSDTSGRYVSPSSRIVNLTNRNQPDMSVVVNLEIITPMSTGTFSVSMSDGNPLPEGLEWMIVVSGSWDPLASGEVTAGVVNYAGTIDEPLPYGLYQLWITGNGYSSGQVMNVQSDSFHHDFVLDRLLGDLIVTVTTNGGADIPAGTAWEILDVNGVVLQSGTFATSAPSGTVLNLENPFEFGVYTLNIAPDTATLGTMSLADLHRDILPFTTTINITNPWATEFPITAELQWAQSDITFSVSMSDGGPLPNGLEWMLVQPPNWDPLASGDIPAGEATYAGEIGEPAPYGSYQLWFTGNGYSSGYVVTVNSTATHRDFVLDRLLADVTVTLDTSDGADLPAGTTWSVTNSAGTVVQSGELTDAIAPGGVLPLTNPFEFDIYTLSIAADGYFPFSMEMNITNSWVSEYAFTATLQEELSQITFTVSMSDGEALPNGLEWMLVPGGSWDPIESGDVTAGEIIFSGQVTDLVPFGTYQLWITGHGYSSGQVLNVNSAETHHDFVLDRLFVDVTVILDTSDDGDIPTGTTWTITDSDGTLVQQGELAEALADGSALPLTNPLEFDVYTLVVDAAGYQTVTMELGVTNPWLSEMTFTVELVADPVTQPDPDPEPDPDRDPAPVPPVTKLPETGVGESGATALSMLMLAGLLITLAAGFLLRLRYRSIRT